MYVQKIVTYKTVFILCLNVGFSNWFIGSWFEFPGEVDSRQFTLLYDSLVHFTPLKSVSLLLNVFYNKHQLIYYQTENMLVCET